jgi:hypothetical protein
VALASVIYLLGGAILAVRLGLYAMPWEVVVYQLPKSLLVSIGLTEVISPMLGIASLYALLALLGGELSEAVPSTLMQEPAWRTGARALRTGERPKLDCLALAKTALFVAVGTLLLVLWRRLGAALAWDATGIIVAVAAALVGTVISVVIFSALRRVANTWGYTPNVFLTATLVAVAFVPLLYWNAVTLPLPYAVVCGTKTQAEVGGWLIGATDSRMILGTTEDDREKRHIVLAPSSSVHVIETDHSPPLPSCPSAS